MVGDDYDLSPPRARVERSSSALVDGDHRTTAVYGNRLIKLPLQLRSATADAAATQLQALAKELVKERNLLKVQIGTAPVFFRTYGQPDFDLAFVKFQLQSGKATLEIEADPFALGLREALLGGFPVHISNDPASAYTPGVVDLDFAAPRNPDPGLETGIGSYTSSGGTFVSDAVVFHTGAKSGKITPNGVSADVNISATPVFTAAGNVEVISAWVRCAVGRAITLGVNWFDAGLGFLSAQSTSVTVTANTWTYVSAKLTAPASSAFATLTANMTGTPAASNIMNVDEMMIGNTLAIPGDVQTPLVAHFTGTGTSGVGGLQSVLAVRRRGVPSGLNHLLQAEAMTVGTDTTTQANSSLMSGSGNNFVRTTFATVTAMATRISAAFPSGGASAQARGTYRVFARVRKNTGSDVMKVELGYGHSTAGLVLNTAVTLAHSSLSSVFADLGLVPCPFGHDPEQFGSSGTDMAASLGVVAFRAQRVSGTGSLDVDYLLFVPAGPEHSARLAVVDWPSTDTTYALDAGSNPDSRMVAYAQNAALDTVLSAAEPSGISGGLPWVSPGQHNRLYFVRDVTPGQTDVMGNTTPVTFYVWPRFLGGFRPPA